MENPPTGNSRTAIRTLEFAAIIADSVRPRVAESAALARVSQLPETGTLSGVGARGYEGAQPEIVCRLHIIYANRTSRECDPANLHFSPVECFPWNCTRVSVVCLLCCNPQELPALSTIHSKTSSKHPSRKSASSRIISPDPSSGRASPKFP
jgi:hypothetical protein